MNSMGFWIRQRNFLALCVLAVLRLVPGPARAQPTILSVSPTNGATGVSTTAKVMFTFSEPMFTTATTAIFTNANTGSFVPVSSAWNAQNNILTCTPTPSFPGNSLMTWYVIGFNPAFQPLSGTTGGSFSTGTSGGSTGSGTNKVTSFAVGKVYEYEQTSAGAATLITDVPYVFSATTTLASNRTASNITLTLPTGAISNLTQNIVLPEEYYLAGFNTNQTAFETTFPQGTCTFNVQATASNQTLAVTLPTSMQQPNAPHLTNYTAAQAINPAQPFTLGWDAFSGGTSTDFVFLTISGLGTNAFQTGTPGATNALTGTARSATIPAHTLQTGGTYQGSLAFYHEIFVTNNSVNISFAYRVSTTRFSLAAAETSGGPLTFTNMSFSNGKFSCDITCSAGQTFTVISSTNPVLPSAQWPVLLTTNSSGTRVRFTDPRAASAPVMLYRARNGT